MKQVFVIAALTLGVTLALAKPSYAQFLVELDASTSSPTSTAYPFSFTSQGVVMCWWHPDELGNPMSGNITEFGLQFINPVNRTWPSVDIYLGEGSHVGSSVQATFAANTNITPFTQVYSGSLSVTTTVADQLWRVQLQNPFYWNTSTTLFALIRVHQPSTGTGTTSHRLRGGTTLTAAGRTAHTSDSNATVATFSPTGQNFDYGVSMRMIVSDDFWIDLNGPNTVEVVDSDSDGTTGDGELLADITLLSGGADWTVQSIEFTVGGTGNGATAFSELALYEDDGNDTWDGSTSDILATAVPGIAFAGPNGTYTATLSDPDFLSGTRRRFFLVGKLAGTATAGQTFEVAVTGLNTTTTGSGVINGLPTAYSAGIEIDEARLEVTYWGPFSPQPLPFDATGPHGDGVLMMEVTFEAFNENFAFAAADIRSFGSGHDADHFAEIALYVDTGSGTWDGAAIDQLIASATAFPADNGTWSPSLAGLSLSQGNELRIYFVAKFNGQAPNGRMFGVTIDALNVSSPTAFQLDGLPFSSAMAVVIDTPLSVSSFDPLVGSRDGGEAITIHGAGFVAPFFARIDGVLAQGTAQVNDSGTVVTGLTVPPGRGADLTISVSAGTRSLQLVETFEYEEIPVIVDVFIPLVGAEEGGDEIVIQGSGFRAPVALTIGGVPVEGEPTIVGGTEITGWISPPGTGNDHEIVLTVEGVEHVLTQRFSYRRPATEGGSGCAALADGSSWPALPLLAFVLLALVARRRLA